MTLSMSSTVRRNDSLLHADAGEELVMLSVAAGNYYSLDRVGRRIWEMLTEPMTIGEICRRLTTEYEVTPEVCEAEVLSFLSEMAEHEVIDVTR